MEKWYLDGHFKLTRSVYQREAIVTEVSDQIEITFLKPITSDKTMSEAWNFMFDWGKKRYPRYVFHFPQLSACLNINDDEETPVFSSCFTSTKRTPKKIGDYYGIDENGLPCKAPDVAKNIYVSFYMHPGEFCFLNPRADLRKFPKK